MDSQINASSTDPKTSKIIGKISWKGGPSIQQNFSLPSTILYYIYKDPSTPTRYLKLAQSCKYFFEKLPILVASDTYADTIICENDEDTCNKNSRKCCVEIDDLEKIAAKIWLTNEINIKYANIPDYISLLSSKLYRSDIIRLEICDQKILFKDFQILATTTVEEIRLDGNKIFYVDNSAVTLDAILEVLPKIKTFSIFSRCSIIRPSTLKKIAKLRNLSNLQKLDLCFIREIPNVKHFVAIIKVKQLLMLPSWIEVFFIVKSNFQEHKNAKFHLKFDRKIKIEFENKLIDLIDDVIEDETMKFLIEYIGQNSEKQEILENRYY